ncbi:hypothetical protein LHP98_12905 [Rhodobacter sp. Har01]|uniref:hypothetical protein n=1 Tax=Rhodobacter sp. Har01 TaxID=2883999 RepID=UPI001D06801B|nr:hypothetical protein [Rhodobacter sp. Har01]MCB6179024.1 hypothetical protein [Rhodobacter sp. Har01]
MADRVIEGFKLPWDGALTENERLWIEILRIVCNDRVPAPDYHQVVWLRERYDCGPHAWHQIGQDETG